MAAQTIPSLDTTIYPKFHAVRLPIDFESAASLLTVSADLSVRALDLEKLVANFARTL